MGHAAKGRETMELAVNVLAVFSLLVLALILYMTAHPH